MAEIINDAAILEKVSQQLIEAARGNVADNYPKDYLYHPLEKTYKVGEGKDAQYYSAWMKREEEGKEFTQIALLTKSQVDKIYADRPGAEPNWNEYTGRAVYSNPNINDDGSAPKYVDDYSDAFHFVGTEKYAKDHGNIEDGTIIDAAIAFDENAKAYNKDEPLPFQSSSLLKSDIADGNVSADDLTRRIPEGYITTNEFIEHKSEDSAKKVVAEEFLIEAIHDSHAQRREVKLGRQEAGIIVGDPDLIYSAANIAFKEKSQASTPAPVIEKKVDVVEPEKQNIELDTEVKKLEEKPEEASEIKTKQIPEPVNNHFNEKVQETRIDGKLNTLDLHLGNGSNQRQINQDVVEILRQFKKNPGDILTEGSKVVEHLRENGLDSHANLMKGYVDKYIAEPTRDNSSRVNYRAARKELQQIRSDGRVVKEAPKVDRSRYENGGGSSGKGVSSEEAVAAVRARIDAVTSPDNIKKMLGDTLEGMPKTMQDKIMKLAQEEIEKSVQHFEDNVKGENRNSPAKSREISPKIDVDYIMSKEIVETTQKVIDGIKEKRPEDLEQVCDRLENDHPELSKNIDCSP